MNPHPDDQIRRIEQDVAALEAGLCPACEVGQPTNALRKLGVTKIKARNKVKILAKTERGWSFKCPLHGTCGRSTSLVLCFLKEKKNDDPA